MGQKVHPLGFRVGITKKHQSQWFSRFYKHKYAQSILEDRLLRKNLSNLFSELLNPILKKIQKRDEGAATTPKITQIKIERGLIPYEIGIQIYAENCDLLKSAISNLKINKNLIYNLQKARRYLLNLTSLQKKGVGPSKKNSLALQSQSSLSGFPNKEKETLSQVELRSSSFDKEKKINSRGSSPRLFYGEPKLNKREQRLQINIKKRLKKRQLIKQRYCLLISKGLFLKKKNQVGEGVFQKLSLKNMAERKKKNRGGGYATPLFLKKTDSQQNFYDKGSRNPTPPQWGGGQPHKLSKGVVQSTPTPYSLKFNQKQKSFEPSLSLNNLPNNGGFGEAVSGNNLNVFGSRIKKKFVNIFVTKMNKKFIQNLKENLKECKVKKSLITNFTPLNYSKKWSLSRLQLLKNQPFTTLNRLVTVLEKKSLVKLESLRNEFLTFGSLSKTQSFAYFQIVNFLKHLKELINQLKRDQKNQFLKTTGFLGKGALVGQSPTIQPHKKKKVVFNQNLEVLWGKDPSPWGTSSFPPEIISSLKPLPFIYKSKQESETSPVEIKVKSMNDTVLKKKLFNIENEYRKIKFIDFLKKIIKKHRTENIYFYLSTIADAQKDLKKLRQFIKRHSNFLFGLNAGSGLPSFPSPLIKNEVEGGGATSLLLKNIKEKVNKIYKKISQKSDYEKTLQDIFIEHIEKQRTMHKENAQLIPKIFIKFYSVKPKSLEAKASVLGSSVVDALEKRKAFRKVIKDAKENLMRKSGIKGVKIQVSGRLNGAEIARTEWVRAGRVPLQTLRANLDYSSCTANTIYGIIGVKVWIFKGYTKLLKNSYPLSRTMPKARRAE